MRTKWTSGALIALCAFAAATGAAQDGSARIPIGVDVGIFYPQNETVKDTFDDQWFRVGITPLGFQRPEQWKFTFDIAYLRNSTSLGRATLMPITFGITRSFGTSSDVRPYVALRVGPYFGDVFSPPLGIDENKIGFDANAALGLTFGNTFYVEARYDVFSDFEGLDFSGFFLSAGVRLFEIRI
ncbi:MAG: hypothetical protein HND42_04890 [Armatimonadetes bacterium]|nr:hypothetical protein [Armatimonadota bacterium]NOG92563.1 hypothetical protein [Armatimonadota bacterium]